MIIQLHNYQARLQSKDCLKEKVLVQGEGYLRLVTINKRLTTQNMRIPLLSRAPRYRLAAFIIKVANFISPVCMQDWGLSEVTQWRPLGTKHTTYRLCTCLTNSIILGVAISGASETMASNGNAIWKSAACVSLLNFGLHSSPKYKLTVGCSPPANQPVLTALRWASICCVPLQYLKYQEGKFHVPAQNAS